ncbi:MAG: DsrE family protein [Thermaerobacter sp.]|nr:DsrE family protein [Thermaerobacter sp.]
MAKFLYVQTRGRENPERCFTVFFLATTARSMDHEAAIAFTQTGLSIFEEGFARQVNALDQSGKTLADFIDMAVARGVQLLGCRLSLPMVRLDPLEDGPWPLEWIGAADLHEEILAADRVVYLS